LLIELAGAGKAILYISHVLEVVERVCDRVIVIAKGRILADAAPGELARLRELPGLEVGLEGVFAQLVQQQETKHVARDLVNVIKVNHV
jgi:ABC-2 type transport system ATP-binding protein